jgi:hypothetical protein
MPYQAKGVPARFVSVGPATAAKASSEGWRLCLRPNSDSTTYIMFEDTHTTSAPSIVPAHKNSCPVSSDLRGRLGFRWTMS